MALPTALRLYRLWYTARDAAEGTFPPWPDRPRGRLVWLHAPDGDRGGRGPLVRQLLEESVADHVLVTCPHPARCPDGMAVAPPLDLPGPVDAFLDHWRPDLGFWLDADLRPVLLHALAARKVPMIMADVASPVLPGARVWRQLVPGALAGFRHVLAPDEDAARTLTKAGATPGAVRVAGYLERPARLLPVNEPERAALARGIGTRPVWLAAAVPETEDDAVAAAHLAALRLAHRLLLILVPDTPARGAELAERLRRQFGLDAVCRSREEDPVEEAQVYVADTEGELGLWYRLAPLTFLGGTLAGPGPLRHPFEAAAMGSALLHGLMLGDWPDAFERLRQAGASRVVPGAADLGEAVGDLLAADRCARLAQAAWGVASAGVEATALAVQLAGAVLDGVDTGPAGPA